MKPILKTVAAAAVLILAAGCEGSADENIGAAAENFIDEVGPDVENAAEDVANTASRVGGAIENGADTAVGELDNGVDVDADANVAVNTQ